MKRKVRNNAYKTTRKAYIGWKHFSEKHNCYKQMHATAGGGIKHHDFQKTATFEKITSTVCSMFFPDNKSSLGLLDKMTYFIANFNGQAISPTLRNGSPFTFEEFVLEKGITPVRIYLLTKDKVNLSY